MVKIKGYARHLLGWLAMWTEQRQSAGVSCLGRWSRFCGPLDLKLSSCFDSEHRDLLYQRQHHERLLEIPMVSPVHPSIPIDLKLFWGEMFSSIKKTAFSLIGTSARHPIWMLQTLQAYSTNLKLGDNHSGKFFLAHSPSIPPQ